MRLYNTLGRKIQDLHPIKPGEIGVYACGPTVYWFAHVGNLRTYVFVDVLRRALARSGLKVKLVMNVTDVGHLSSDADEGEDKMLIAMRREGKTAYDIARFYEEAFVKDLGRLNILPADAMPRATDHIEGQIDMIKRLEKNGFTYQTADGIYFDTSKLPEYGMLSGQKAEDKKAGARVEMGEKKNPTDFALWKISPSTSSGHKREMEWESPWGKGFPGWHIECSAMSKQYLGAPFDIHTGGIDHVPVHHENEIAQTQGAEGVLEANVWMHGEFLTVDGGKMSKSLGNLFTLDDLMSRGYDPLAFRYFCFGAHYRTKLNFTWEALTAAQNALNRLREIVRGWDTPGNVGCADHENAFLAAIEDDLNTPEALAAMWKMIEDASLPTSARSRTVLFMDQVFGLKLGEFIGKPVEVPEDVKMLVQAREAARKAKDWKESDRLRDEIATRGFTVEDGLHGPVIKKA
ncbi:cysteine--tRNA ligase [Candidatus Uhrbacteria bacterium RIFCSPHIGHO2_01_FULL_63_20]|uniref:Cysteine--tRNA ligase n=1 Tax=Candidatus Uhrbacteria bacterium RIFCSPHIGHO2_01_FULL_63_20 TaxID=1802385 RepID=A0A1F7TLW2_9BACT|nr:MAG: cysteine--tRNA ligase [Candidatus Uhrbacteria bacterium RIFCSPHIGHO2_01_FULL_63_20]